MPKRSRVLDIKQASMLETRVFEDGGKPDERVEFVWRDLVRWGYDLVSGTRNGRSGWFLAEVEEGRKAGDSWQTETGESLRAERIHDALPEDTRLVGQLAMRDGRAMLRLSLAGAVEEGELAELPAAEVLLYCLNKERRFRLLGALRDVGRLTALEASHGQEGKSRPLDELPAVFKRVLREARALGREVGGSRIALAGFGAARDGRQRYRMHWMLPTLALFRRDVSERVDALLDALP